MLTFLIPTAISIGCKPPKQDTTAQKTPTVDDPFENTSTGGNSKKHEGGVVLSQTDQELIIPGSGMGKVSKANKKAKAKKTATQKALNPSQIPYGHNIDEQMEGLKWGMSVKKVISQFENKVRATFDEELKLATGDALQEDQIRTRMIREINKVHKSHVKFEGQRTGFESHMISGEFTHNNNESMIVWDAGKYVEYLFFIDNRFWKRIRAFRKDSFSSEITFDDFVSTVENKVGSTGQAVLNKKNKTDRVEWRDNDTFLAALDRADFFGAYGLRFSAVVTQTNIAKLRKNKDRNKGQVSNEVSDMVNAVTSAQGSLTDHNTSVIDSYTGSKPAGSSDNGSTKLSKGNSVTGKQHRKQLKKDQKVSAKERKKEATQDDIDDLF